MADLSSCSAAVAEVVARSNDAILVLACDSTIASCNPAAAAIYGFARAELIGRRFDRVLPDDLREIELRRIARAAAGESTRAPVAARVRGDGIAIIVSSTLFPIRDERNHTVAVGAIERDITREHALQADLLRARRAQAIAEQLLTFGERRLVRGSADGIRLGAATETILFVDDEPEVRDVVARALRCHGFHVLAARDGEDALSVADAYDAPIHLVISDVIMPNMNGRELFDRLRTWYPSLRFLFVSGYASGAIGTVELRGPATEFLAKPFSIESLLGAVRALLDREVRSCARSE